MIPANIAICEKGFSKQDLIKSYLHSSLKLVKLEALMHIVHANIPIENINWNVVFILWKNLRDHRIYHL